MGRQYIYVILEVFERQSAEGGREIEVNGRLNRTSSSHEDAMFVRTALDNFQIGPADAYYRCLVHKPLGISLCELRNRCTAKILPEEILKLALIYVLLALDSYTRKLTLFTLV